MMDLSFGFFLEQMAANPALLITVLLTLGVIAVNGITDAPNGHCHLRIHPIYGCGLGNCDGSCVQLCRGGNL